MKKNKKYIHHIIKKLAGDISPSDQKELTAWLAADAKNKEEYDLIVKIVAEGQQMEFADDPNVHDEWKAFEFPADWQPKRDTFSFRWRALGESIASFLRPRHLVYAALIIFLIGGSAFWYYRSKDGIETITTANRQQKEITLSDGTTVYLNCGTELLYPRKFSGSVRKVRLTGEAFFEVVKSKSPFVVQTSEGTVTVLGTRFNIWARDFQMRIIVEEGRVRFEAGNIANSVILNKDSMSEISHNQPPSKARSVNAKELLGWRSGKLVFTHTMLSELAGEIGRYYDVDVAIENPELEKKTITAVFDRLSLKKVLYAICSTLDIQYKYQDGSYIFYKEHMPDDQ